MGGGDIRKAIYTLIDLAASRSDTELIIVCGSNRKLYDELSALSLPKVTVIGFTDDMAGYMKAADLFVTKPGGLSSTEAAVCGVPLVHVAENTRMQKPTTPGDFSFHQGQNEYLLQHIQRRTAGCFYASG